MYTLEQIIDGVESIQYSGQGRQVEILHFTCDSRKVRPGSLFIAVKGGASDGHDFVDNALESGASAVIYEQNRLALSSVADKIEIPLIEVTDTRRVYAELASFWYQSPSSKMTLIGVTGTNGKTTVTWILEEMLAAQGVTVGVIGTVNYRIRKGDETIILQEAPLTTPDAATLYENLQVMSTHGVTHVVMEVASHGIHQQRVAGLEFDVAVFTNLSRDHLDYHKTLEKYFSVKKQLFTRLLKKSGVAVIVVEPTETCAQNWGEKLALLLTTKKVLTCGLNAGNDISASGIRQTVYGSQCRMRIASAEVEVNSYLTGKFNILNLLAAAGVGHALGVTPADIAAGLSKLEKVPGRMERVAVAPDYGSGQPAVFVDYAHTPDALENALKTITSICEGRLVCVFGCGGDRDRGKRPEMGRISGTHADVSIVTSDNPRSENPDKIIADIVNGLSDSRAMQCSINNAFAGLEKKVFSIISDRGKAIRTACQNTGSGDCVLIAGKGHESYQLIDGKKKFFDDKLVALDGLISWNRDHLSAAVQGELICRGKNDIFAKIATDSRLVEQNDIFVALQGEQFDGHDYLQQAAEKGAGAFIVEKECMPPAGVLTIRVADTLAALGELAKYRRRLLGKRLNVIGITGSSGKTTVKEMTASVFSAWYKDDQYDEPVDFLIKTKGNFNNLIGLPLSLLPVQANHKTAILEMGMNRLGEIEQLTKICEPDIGCITNIQPAHLLGLGDINGVAAAKGELFETMASDATMVVNLDDPNVRKRAKQGHGKQLGFAVTPRGRRYKPFVKATRIVNEGEKGTRFTLTAGDKKTRISLQAPGVHNVANAAAASAIAVAAGISLEVIKKGIERYVSFDKRMHMQKLICGINIINDAYNANPSSMTAALQTLATFGDNCKRIAVLGDMLELGEAAVDKHRQIGAVAAHSGLEALAVYGDHAADIKGGALLAGFSQENIYLFNKHQDMATWLYHLITNGALTARDWILIKGSRGMRMEAVIEQLEDLLTP